ncbi:MAG: hypothetical protein QOD42_1752 [Sphingomonadales bacterium]|jgi:hypothetical protein|nr:hypothetical protein [Sphingomonadales bacterium]
MLKFLMAFAAMLVPAAASAEGWRHAQSRIEIAELPAGLHVASVSDGRGDGSDVIVQLGDDDDAVTLYVYRAAFPNPALWFERTRLAMRVNVAAPLGDVAPRSFTLGTGAAPNGLREEIAIPPGNRFRSTAVAMAQNGEWMIKLRISSTSLDRPGIAARMDALLAAIALPAGAPAPLPLVVPAACPDANAMRGRQRRQSMENSLLGVAAILEAHNDARGRSGLAAEPANWCREATRFPVEQVAVYRRRDGKAWAALLGDAGLAVSAYLNDDPQLPGAMTYAANPSITGLAFVYDAMPGPDEAVEPALPFLVGRARSSVSINASESRSERR